jgi:hypothetical protein
VENSTSHFGPQPFLKIELREFAHRLRSTPPRPPGIVSDGWVAPYCVIEWPRYFGRDSISCNSIFFAES